MRAMTLTNKSFNHRRRRGVAIHVKMHTRNEKGPVALHMTSMTQPHHTTNRGRSCERYTKNRAIQTLQGKVSLQGGWAGQHRTRALSIIIWGVCRRATFILWMRTRKRIVAEGGKGGESTLRGGTCWTHVKRPFIMVMVMVM